MTLKQLRYLCEISRRGFHLSHAADSLNTSQPGVSRQIQLLEEELGVEIFKRKKNRILGLTQPGREIFRFAEDVLSGVRNIKDIGRDQQDEAVGSLIIATTHTQARYVLPPVVRQFSAAFPNVQLQFWQGSRQDMLRMVESGKADMAISTDCQMRFDNIILLPCGQMHRSIVTRPDHPLLRNARPTLEDIASYPVISYGFDNNGRWRLSHVFEAHGLTPRIVFGAADADVCKAYVELGLGIAVMASVAYDPVRDQTLRVIEADHLFDAETLYVAVNRTQFLRGYAYKFISMLAPELTRDKVQQLSEPRSGSALVKQRSAVRAAKNGKAT